MPWFHAVAETDHAIQNPTSAEKIRRLGELLRLGPESRVLDLACGRGGPARILAAEFGCRIVGVERAPEFVEVARRRVAEAGLEPLIEVIERDARAFPLEPAASTPSSASARASSGTGSRERSRRSRRSRGPEGMSSSASRTGDAGLYRRRSTRAASRA